MIKSNITINNIPAILWGEKSDKIYIFVHGKMSNKESAYNFSKIAISKGYQVLSFDLPEHGERKDKNYKCNVWNGIHDLKIISDFVQKNWSNIYLFACSLGAYFSLLAYNEINIKKCLFQSPIVDMNDLILKMFKWFNVTDKLLEEKGEIYTPIDTLSWKYYCFVKDNPIKNWNVPTEILYGSLDKLQDRTTIDKFVKNFKCNITVSLNSDHPFDSEDDMQIINNWLLKHI